MTNRIMVRPAVRAYEAGMRGSGEGPPRLPGPPGAGGAAARCCWRCALRQSRPASMLSPRHHRVAPRLELAAGLPLRPFVGLGDPQADPEEQVRIPRRAAQVPPRLDHVRHLVVVDGHILVAPHPAVVGGLADDIQAGLRVECGDADPRELEVVGTEEIPLLGVGVRDEHAPVLPKGLLRHVIDRGVAIADVLDIARGPRVLHAVDVDVRERPGERVEGVLRVVLGAEEALLLRRDGEEEDGAPRSLPCGQARETPGDFQEPGAPQGVVLRAVEDLVALQAGVAPKMVPVRRVDDVLAAPRGVGSLELRDHVPGREGGYFGGAPERDREGSDPSSFAITFRDARGRILLETANVALAVRSTGRKSFRTAAALSASKSNPAAEKRLFA